MSREKHAIDKVVLFVPEGVRVVKAPLKAKLLVPRGCDPSQISQIPAKVYEYTPVVRVLKPRNSPIKVKVHDYNPEYKKVAKKIARLVDHEKAVLLAAARKCSGDGGAGAEDKVTTTTTLYREYKKTARDLGIKPWNGGKPGGQFYQALKRLEGLGFFTRHNGKRNGHGQAGIIVWNNDVDVRYVVKRVAKAAKATTATAATAAAKDVRLVIEKEKAGEGEKVEIVKETDAEAETERIAEVEKTEEKGAEGKTKAEPAGPELTGYEKAILLAATKAAGRVTTTTDLYREYRNATRPGVEPWNGGRPGGDFYQALKKLEKLGLIEVHARRGNKPNRIIVKEAVKEACRKYVGTPESKPAAKPTAPEPAKKPLTPEPTVKPAVKPAIAGKACSDSEADRADKAGRADKVDSAVKGASEAGAGAVPEEIELPGIPQPEVDVQDHIPERFDVNVEAQPEAIDIDVSDSIWVEKVRWNRWALVTDLNVNTLDAFALVMPLAENLDKIREIHYSVLGKKKVYKFDMRKLKKIEGNERTILDVVLGAAKQPVWNSLIPPYVLLQMITGRPDKDVIALARRIKDTYDLPLKSAAYIAYAFQYRLREIEWSGGRTECELDQWLLKALQRAKYC